jgi:hypothetical protein
LKKEQLRIRNKIILGIFSMVWRKRLKNKKLYEVNGLNLCRYIDEYGQNTLALFLLKTPKQEQDK